MMAETGSRPITCPYCGGTVPLDSTVCPDCQEELAGLIKLERWHLILYNQALASAKSGDLVEAAWKSIASLESNGAFGPAYALLAKVRARQGRWEQATWAIESALALAPGDASLESLAEAVARGRRAAEPPPPEDETEEETLAQEEPALAAPEPEAVTPSREAPRRSSRVGRRQRGRSYGRGIVRFFSLGAGLARFLKVLAGMFGGGRHRGGD